MAIQKVIKLTINANKKHYSVFVGRRDIDIEGRKWRLRYIKGRKTLPIDGGLIFAYDPEARLSEWFVGTRKFAGSDEEQYCEAWVAEADVVTGIHYYQASGHFGDNVRYWSNWWDDFKKNTPMKIVQGQIHECLLCAWVKPIMLLPPNAITTTFHKFHKLEDEYVKQVKGMK